MNDKCVIDVKELVTEVEYLRAHKEETHKIITVLLALNKRLQNEVKRYKGEVEELGRRLDRYE